MDNSRQLRRCGGVAREFYRDPQMAFSLLVLIIMTNKTYYNNKL